MAFLFCISSHLFAVYIESGRDMWLLTIYSFSMSRQRKVLQQIYEPLAVVDGILIPILIPICFTDVVSHPGGDETNFERTHNQKTVLISCDIKSLTSGGFSPWAKRRGGGGRGLFWLPCRPFVLLYPLHFLPKIRAQGPSSTSSTVVLIWFDVFLYLVVYER